MKTVTYTEIDYQELETMLRERFSELDKTIIREPYGEWERKNYTKEDGMVHQLVEWSFVAEIKSPNDVSHTFELYKLEPEDMPDDAHKPPQYSECESWLKYREGKSNYVPVQYLMEVLCSEGKLPEGPLLVHVSW